MTRIRSSALLLGVALVLALPTEAWARIKLVTLPVRDRVAIQLDNPSATLVEEERTVPLLAGVNQIDFSWANTRIDPDTIVFRVLEAGQRVNVLSVSYPPGESALVWSVASERAGTARIRISYLIGNLERTFSYRALADAKEQTLSLSQYLRVKNLANESFEEATLHMGFGQPIAQSVGLAETRELLAGRYARVPIRKTYTADLAENGYLEPAKRKLRVPMHYVLRNDADNGLGRAALPAGKVRIFQQTGAGGSAFIGEDWGKFTPRDDELELYLGLARDVGVTRTVERNERRRVAGNLFEYDVLVKYEIENFKDTPVTLDVVEHLQPLRAELGISSPRPIEWTLGRETSFPGGPITEKSDAEMLHFRTDLPARSADDEARKVTRRIHLVLKNEW